MGAAEGDWHDTIEPVLGGGSDTWDRMSWGMVLGSLP